MRFSLKLSHKGFILIALPLIFEVVFVVALYSQLRQAEFLADRQFDAKQCVTAANDLIRLSYDAGTALFSLHLTKDPAFAERYSTAFIHMADQLDFLKTKTVNDPGLLESVVRMEHLVNQAREVLQTVKRSFEEGSGSSLRGTAGLQEQLKPIINGLVNEVHQFTDQENREGYINPELTLRSRLLLRQIIVFGIALNVLMAIGLAIFFNTGTAQRLKTLLQNTERLTRHQELNPPIAGTDELAHLDHVFHDMADELEEASQKERAFTEFAPDVIASIDADGKFTKLNPACLKVWGYNAEELIGRSFCEIIATDDKSQTERVFSQAKAGQSRAPFENAVVSKAGSIVYHRFSPRWSEEQQSFYCVFHDITEPKRIEQIKQQFVAMVSHDLRSPLMSIMSILDMLAAGLLGEISNQAKQKVDMALNSSTRLVTLVNDLLDVEKLEAGQMRMNFGTVSLDSVIEKSISALERIGEQAEVALEGQATGIQVVADGDRLIQVLVNLIGNAIKFSPPKSTVSVSVVESLEYVEIRVTDMGRGVPPEFREAIFERFRQVEISDATEKGGTGLGLPICKSIVEQHGGAIGVESEMGKGSTFWFRVPRKQVGIGA
jgi:PAS domain S-box-containing protein